MESYGADYGRTLFFFLICIDRWSGHTVESGIEMLKGRPMDLTSYASKHIIRHLLGRAVLSCNASVPQKENVFYRYLLRIVEASYKINLLKIQLKQKLRTCHSYHFVIHYDSYSTLHAILIFPMNSTSPGIISFNLFVSVYTDDLSSQKKN